MKILSCIIVIAILALPTVSPAEEDSPTESARELMAPLPSERMHKTWEASVDGSWLPKSDSSDAGGSVGMNEAKLKLARTFTANPSLSFTPELVYSLLHISAPNSARLPENLHSISLGLRSDYRANPKLSFSFLLAPGLAGDFTEIGHDDIRVRFGSTVRWKASEKLTVLGGLIYQQGYRSLPVFPIVGAVYRPDEKWTYSLAAPRSGVSYAPRQDVRLDLGLEFSGGEYQLHEERIGAKVIRYRDFRFVAGAGFTIVARLKGEVAAGYAFAKKFIFYDEFDPARGDIEVDAGPFVRAGLKMEW